jgi:O-antigen/teichoic acid export membrane protein
VTSLSTLRRARPAFLVEPLTRNAAALMLASIGTGMLGAAYWFTAARMLPAAAVGRGSALVSAAILIAGVSQLNLPASLPRLLPVSGSRVGAYILRGYGAALVVAAALALLAVTSGALATIVHQSLDAPTAVLFVALTALWTVFALQDSVLAGLRRATWVPIENISFGATKLILLVAIAASVGYGVQEDAIVASWLVPMIATLIAVNVLIFSRIIPATPPRAASGAERAALRVRRYLAAEYVAGLAQVVAINVIPLLVVEAGGATLAGHFYMAWIGAIALESLANSVATSLTVEAARAPDSLPVLVPRALRMGFAVVVPAAVATALLASPVLGALGRGFREDGAVVLAVMAAGVALHVPVAVAFSAARVRQRLRIVLWVPVVQSAALLAWCFSAMRYGGVEDVAIGYAVIQGVSAIALVPFLRDTARASLAPRSRHGVEAGVFATPADVAPGGKGIG